jgi:mono/diheme cytochrome c family protein
MPLISLVRRFIPAVLLAATTAYAADLKPDLRAFVEDNCWDCHGSGRSKGDLSLEKVDFTRLADNPDVFEKILRKLDHRLMPPVDEPRPDENEYRQITAHLTAELDRAAAAHPQPGRTDSLRRLNRTEYQNAVRDLLAVEVDATTLLPQDEPAHGFDNVMVGNLSPTLMDRYVTAAQKVARLAVGASGQAAGGDTIRLKPEVTQERHVEGLPPGTRGGVRIPYNFPQDGEYEISVRLVRDRNEMIEGLRASATVEFLLDRKQLEVFTVKPPGSDKNWEEVDRHLRHRLDVTAGPHELAVTFPAQPNALFETVREPYVSRFNIFRHPRTAPAVYQVSVTGPFHPRGPGTTPGRRRILAPLDGLAAGTTAEARARAVLAPLMRRAYRRPVGEADFTGPLQQFSDGFAGGDFDLGIERALAAVLVNPQFLFRIERDPPGAAPGTVYAVTQLELASRLAFFLWSSLPDDELLDCAGRGELRQPAVLERQVRRMLADGRARNLVTNFAAQWLHLRALDAVTPDQRKFIDFDDNLRQALRTETELFVASVMEEDRSVLDLLRADYTFLNERLARHYGIPHIQGSRFRRVSFAGDPMRQRGGLLRQGSVLTVTSYATRTSPVIRGKWILDNLLGTPPPPPPPDVSTLDERVISAALPIRARFAAHRSKPVCASCHKVIDPIGFALEEFDAVGRHRDLDDFRPVDAAGGLPDGSKFDGVAGLEAALLARPELFAGNVVEKLFIFALGRDVAPHDAPAIRAITRQAAADDYRFSALILGLVQSDPFQLRTTP